MLESWRSWKPDGRRLSLVADGQLLDQLRPRPTIHRNWAAATCAPDFCAPDDTRLHLGLIPQPLVGDVLGASIYILLLNPGLSPDDHYGEYEVPAYRRALLANLKQQWHREAVPFIFLDPQYSWHAGFAWWHGKFARVIERLAASRCISFASARRTLASRLASIELIPYHSARFSNRGHLIERLRSAELARDFVRQVVVPRVKQGKAIAIVARQARAWDLPSVSGVVKYTGAEARGAHLTPASRGGKAILRQLGCT